MTRPFRCYVAAPFADGPEVRRKVPGRLAAIGVLCTSRWLDQANGPEDFTASREERRGLALQNDADVRAADVVLLVDPDHRGGETYAEARLALAWGTPVVWFGRPILSSCREGVTRVASVDEAIIAIKHMAESR